MVAENDSLLGVDDSAVETNRDPLTGGISLSNLNSDRNILEVTSKGEVTVPTSISTVELGIQVEAATAAEAQQQVAQQATSVVDVLENLDVEELQTTSVRLFPVYSFEDDTRELTGFEARNTLSFELPNESAGAAIDAAIEAGANLVQNISFSATDEDLQQARLQALQQAIEQAQIEAETVFNTLDLVAEEIVGIEILSVGASNPISQPLQFEVAAQRDTTALLNRPKTSQT
jgi:uncharacterized protein YggE